MEPRPIVKEWLCNGKTYKNFLGYYPVQITSLKILLKTLSQTLNIPLEAPNSHNFEKDCYSGKFKGIVGHY
jgi:hypothetical protein